MDSQTSIIAGNYVLIGCCIVYLIWWSIAFNPRLKLPFAPKAVLFFVTLALGIISIVFIVGGITGIQAKPPIPNFAICLGGVALYLLLLVLSSKLLHRQVTTELVLIVGWVVLELCLINSLFGCGSFATTAAIVAIMIVLVSAAIGLACYLAYYQLEEMKAFFIGMVPLILFAIAMLAVNLLATH